MPTPAIWTAEEDELLRSYVDELGSKKWAAIAGRMGTKSSKQCRRRWKNYLELELKKGGWAEEEDKRLVQLVGKYGNKWTLISQEIGGRTDNAVKNRYAALSKRFEKVLAAEGGEHGSPGVSRCPSALSGLSNASSLGPTSTEDLDRINKIAPRKRRLSTDQSSDLDSSTPAALRDTKRPQKSRLAAAFGACNELMCLPGDGTVPPGSPAAANLHRGLSGIGRSGSLLHEPSSPGSSNCSGRRSTAPSSQGMPQPVHRMQQPLMRSQSGLKHASSADQDQLQRQCSAGSLSLQGLNLPGADVKQEHPSPGAVRAQQHQHQHQHQQHHHQQQQQHHQQHHQYQHHHHHHPLPQHQQLGGATGSWRQGYEPQLSLGSNQAAKGHSGVDQHRLQAYWGDKHQHQHQQGQEAAPIYSTGYPPQPLHLGYRDLMHPPAVPAAPSSYPSAYHSNPYHGLPQQHQHQHQHQLQQHPGGHGYEHGQQLHQPHHQLLAPAPLEHPFPFHHQHHQAPQPLLVPGSADGAWCSARPSSPGAGSGFAGMRQDSLQGNAPLPPLSPFRCLPIISPDGYCPPGALPAGIAGMRSSHGGGSSHGGQMDPLSVLGDGPSGPGSCVDDELRELAGMSGAGLVGGHMRASYSD